MDDSARLQGELADRDAWTAERCSIDRALAVVGNRSALLLLREAHYGTRRFDDFARRAAVTEAAAATRLRALVDAGLMTKRPYQEPGQRTRHEYVLTQAGVDLLPVLLGLMQWGDKWAVGDDEPPLHLEHLGCGASVEVQVVCARGHAVPQHEVAVWSKRERSGAASKAGAGLRRPDLPD